MGSANFTIPLILQSNGDIIDATEAMAELTNIETNFNPTGMSGYQDTLAEKKLQEDPATGLTTSLAKDIEQLRFAMARAFSTTWWYEAPSVVLAAVPPIGSIIPFYDFNAALTFDTTYWVYCDGQSATVGGVSRTLPDLSGRYLVGFGTPNGGGDIDTAAWATAAVGATSHTSASIAHTHTGPSHTHGVGSYQFKSFEIIQTAGYVHQWNGYDSGGTATEIWRASTSGGGTGVDEGLTVMTDFGNTTVPFYTSSGTGSSASGGTGATGSSLSTISVQPESIRVRYIMRKA